MPEQLESMCGLYLPSQVGRCCTELPNNTLLTVGEHREMPRISGMRVQSSGGSEMSTDDMIGTQLRRHVIRSHHVPSFKCCQSQRSEGSGRGGEARDGPGARSPVGSAI